MGSAKVVSAIIYVFGEPLGSCGGVDGSSGILAGDDDAGRWGVWPGPRLQGGEGAGGLWLCPFLRRWCGGDLEEVRGYLREERAGSSSESDGGGIELL